ncbi:hypothetical protein [Tengunoibacter tsumagoiensis]|uniref:BON domain-containing protein n=1 Tax=Tengunoibacter tsumagoiensis TaxID=2014871 RepID=A0A402A5H8_9CHLR|nr:hypothetical protein [Tengunoibacter tsumagoiensis]GCE14397.1 hypothetical protein KTT_42560 [Tengunoibacter tsumagoiensis]
MDTSLQRTSLVEDELEPSTEAYQETEEEEHHIHLPRPSLWPFLLSAAILITVAGLLFIPDSPWLSLIAAPFILVGTLGWALEDPMGSEEAPAQPRRRYEPTLSAQQVLDRARAIVESTVTFGSTAYSTHPVKVELENEGPEGVVLALYGKLELQAQREAITEALADLPNVVELKNFIVAEDEILQTAYKRVDDMKSKGKLDGAQGISLLVENYILHIYGDVPNSTMKYALERELIGIPGVKVVVNHIGLNKNIPGNLGKTRNA